jgi:hypothetical protein
MLATTPRRIPQPSLRSTGTSSWLQMAARWTGLVLGDRPADYGRPRPWHLPGRGIAEVYPRNRRVAARPQDVAINTRRCHG